MKRLLFSSRRFREKVAVVLGAALLCNLMIPALAEAKKPKNTYAVPAYNDIANMYLPSLAKKEVAENKIAQKINEFNANLKVNEGHKFKMNKASEVEALRIFYQIFGLQKNSTDKENENVLNKNTLNDLNMFCGDKSELENTLFAKLDNTQTLMGKIQLQKMLFQPTTDISELKKRQAIVRKLVSDEDLFNSLDKKLQEIREVEAEITFFWKQLEKEVFTYFNKLYYQKDFLQESNTSSFGMEMCHDFLNVGGIIPLIFLITFGCTVYKFRGLGIRRALIWAAVIQGGCVLYLGLIELVSKIVGAPSMTNQILDNIETARRIQQKMINTASLENEIEEISEKLEKTGKFSQKGLKQDDEQAQDFLNLLKKGTFKGQPSFFSFNGRVLASFKQMYEVKDKLVGQLKAVGQVDAYLSIAKLYKKHARNSNATYSFVEYVEILIKL